MAIYSKIITVPATYGDSSHPDATIPFMPHRIMLVNEDQTYANYVEFSFDGSALAGRLRPGANPGVVVHQRQLKIWTRRGAGTPTVILIAESYPGDD